jgi:hypothetical protein
MPENKEEERVFTFYFNGTFNLKTSQIWPEGDAPEDPKPEDIISLIEHLSSTDSTFSDCLSELNNINITVSHENDISEILKLTPKKKTCQNSQQEK